MCYQIMNDILRNCNHNIIVTNNQKKINYDIYEYIYIYINNIYIYI